MPRKDPMTGCQVMTLDELAAYEGTTASEMLEPMFEEFDQESKRREEEIRLDPIAFFESVLHACPIDYEWHPPPFVSGEVLTASVSYNFRRSHEQATMRFLDARGAPWIVVAGVVRSDGGMWEPPDEETTVHWTEA